MLDFEIIQRLTQADDTDLSLNLKNQRVVIIGRNGKPSVRKYTVYNVRFEGKHLKGNVHRKNDDNQPWPEYQFNAETREWYQTPASQKIDRDTKAADVPVKELRRRYARGERLNRAEFEQLYEAYPELEKVHRPPEAQMSKEERIHRTEQRRSNWKRLTGKDID